jgi:hypothetical protein
MHPVENPEKQAPTPKRDGESTARSGKDHGSERPQDDQIFHDWASI